MLQHKTNHCLCGSKETFNHCCGKFINSYQKPANPEQLMRSRYSAYELKDSLYLLNSWHYSTRPESLELENDSTQWKALKIISANGNNVQFVAYFTQDTLNNKKIYALTEISNFINEEDWFYVDGEDVKTVQVTKNMPCPCQSGKKYKRCCEKDLAI